MRIISGGKWTLDGRWVVVAEWYGSERIVFDPDNADGARMPNLEGPPLWASLLDIRDCVDFVKENRA